MSRPPFVNRIPPLLLILAAAGAVAVSLAVLPAIAADPPAKSVHHADLSVKTLIKVDEEWSKAASTRDPDRVASFYADDAIAYPPGEPVARGRAAARNVWASYFADPTFTISWTTDDADVSASGELGYTAGAYQDSFTGPDGKPVRETGKYVCIWKRQPDGTWKAVHDIWNADAR